MPRSTIRALQSTWRTDLFSTDSWTASSLEQMRAGEAGGYRVDAITVPFGAYLKPTKLCDEHNPRAANEKVVADIAGELGFSVPPVLLYKRNGVVAGEETRCCVSLVMYPRIDPWEFLFDISGLPVPVQHLVRASISGYSETLALDLLIGQTDRHGPGNVVLGSDPDDPSDTAFMFLDHSFTLNYGNRWAANGWTSISPVPLPATFSESISKRRLIEGAEKVVALPDDRLRLIVSRVPTDYMSDGHRQMVCDGLIGRKQLLRKYIERNY